MLSYKNKLLRTISIIVIHVLLLSDVAFAIPESGKNTLSPPSRFWDEETVRSIRAGETYGKSFRNRVAFRDISTLIGQYLHLGISPHTLIPEIKKHIDAAEFKLLKTHPHLDPILAGCELDELTYNKEGNAYYLPIYRKGIKKFNYKFYIAEKPEDPDDWTIPLGDGNKVYVRLEGVTPEPKSGRIMLDPEKIKSITDDEYFLEAVTYFNREVLGTPLTWEKVIDLFEIFRGDRRNLEYTKDIRAQRLTSVKDALKAKLAEEEICDIVTLANESFHPDNVLGAVARVFCYVIRRHIFWHPDSYQWLPGFDKIEPLSQEKFPNPSSGHHRLAWFMMNYILINNGYTPFYFEKEELGILPYKDEYQNQFFFRKIIKKRVSKIDSKNQPTTTPKPAVLDIQEIFAAFSTKYDGEGNIKCLIDALKQKLENLQADEVDFLFKRWPPVIGNIYLLSEICRFSHIGEFGKSKLELLDPQIDKGIDTYRKAPRIPETEIFVVAEGLKNREVSRAVRTISKALNIIREVSPGLYNSVLQNTMVFLLERKQFSAGYVSPFEPGLTHLEWKRIWVIDDLAANIVHENAHNKFLFEDISSESSLRRENPILDIKDAPGAVWIALPFIPTAQSCLNEIHGTFEEISFWRKLYTHHRLNRLKRYRLKKKIRQRLPFKIRLVEYVLGNLESLEEGKLDKKFEEMIQVLRKKFSKEKEELLALGLYKLAKKSSKPASSSAEEETQSSYASEDKSSSAESENKDFSKTGFELETNPEKRSQIIERNRNYLQSKGWLKPIEKLPYETIFVLEDEKFIDFLEAIIRRDKWMRGIDYLAEFREAFKRDLNISLPRKKEEKVDYNKLIRNNIKSFAHLLQSAYFYAQGSDEEGRKAFQKYCKTKGKGLAMCFCPHDKFIHEHYFCLAEFIYLQDMHDYTRARFLLNLSLKMFNWQNVFSITPEHFATFLGTIDVWTGKKRGITALKSSLPIHNRFASEILPKWAKYDTELGEGLRAHFNQTKTETLKASALVKEKGTAVVFGAGRFVVLPLVEMLREKLPDGSFKYEKIILIDLAEDYSEPALQRLIDDGKITKEEAARVEIIVEDVTMLLDKITQRIDEIILKAISSSEEKQIPIEELYQFIEEIADLRKLISYALPHAKRRLQKESVNFVVFAMSLNDFTNTIKDYIDMWIKGFPQWMGGRHELEEKWRKYSDIIESGLALLVIDEASRILVPEGILFFADSIGGEEPDSEKKGKKEKHIFLKSKFLRKTIKQAFSGKGQDFYLREVNSASWRRPTNDIEWKEGTGRKIIIGALTYEKAYKTQKLISNREKPQAISLSKSEQAHATLFTDNIKLIQAKEKQPLILALGTSWMKGYEKGRYLQYDALNPLITSIRKFCESRDIPFITGDDNELLAAINTERQKAGKENAKVIVLAGQDTVTSKEFEPLRNDKSAFLVGVNNENLTIDSYIRLMEMLTLTLKLAFDQDIDLSNPNIIVKKEGNIYIFIPKAEPMDYEDLREIYKLQTFA